MGSSRAGLLKVVSDPLRVALQVARLFEQLGIRYALGGALASSLLGEPRATQDIDMVVEIDTAQIEPLLRALEQEFYVPEGPFPRAVTERGSVNLLHYLRSWAESLALADLLRRAFGEAGLPVE